MMTRQRINEYLQLDTPSSITFYGSPEAELFTRQISRSFQGFLDNNYLCDEENAGFTQASNDGRYWTGTMWPRDAGTILRELTMYGRYGRACLTSIKLMELVEKNPDGFYSYPEYFHLGEHKYGYELDGTCSIVIAMLLLLDRLRLMDAPLLLETAGRIEEFLTCSSSPIRYMIRRTENGLVSGTGEFGGGCRTEGEWCNSVQNFLVYYTLSLAQTSLLAHRALSDTCAESALRLKKAIETWLIGDKIIWCVHPETLKPVKEVLEHPFNRDASFVNGAGAMYSDVFGFSPEQDGFWASSAVKNTFYHLLNTPNRRKYFDKYGFYSQFEDFCSGTLTSASYGFGYALQLAVIYDLPERDAMIRCLIRMTDQPDSRYRLDRADRGWFYERYYVPEVWTDNTVRHDCQEGDDIAHQGCGALNVVNVAEPLKIARLLAGVENTQGTLRFHPRLPKGFAGVKLENWTAAADGKLIIFTADIH